METKLEKALRELESAQEALDFIKDAFETEREKRRELERAVDKLIDENYYLRWLLEYRKLMYQQPKTKQSRG